MPSIKLQSSDGEVFNVDIAIAKCSETIKSMIEHLGMKEEDDVVPLPNVTAVVLKKVVEWATKYVNDSALQEDIVNNKTQEIAPLTYWEADFLKANREYMTDLILAANYLDVKRLLDITCELAAERLRGKTAEEMKYAIQRDIIGIKPE